MVFKDVEFAWNFVIFLNFELLKFLLGQKLDKEKIFHDHAHSIHKETLCIIGLSNS